MAGSEQRPKEIIMDAVDGEGASFTGAAIVSCTGRQVPEEKAGWRSREQTAYQRSAEGVDRLLRVPLGGVHCRSGSGLEPLQAAWWVKQGGGRAAGPGGSSRSTTLRQAAPGREPQAGERAFHDCTPSFRSGISTRKVWPNTFPEPSACISEGRMDPTVDSGVKGQAGMHLSQYRRAKSGRNTLPGTFSTKCTSRRGLPLSGKPAVGRVVSCGGILIGERLPG